MKIIKMHFANFIVLIISIMLMNACRPPRNFINAPKARAGNCKIKSTMPGNVAVEKSVSITTDYKLTEQFDILPPFYLSNATEKSKLYIVAKEKTPILIKSDLFVIPQLSFIEAEAMKIPADVIVIPVIH